MESVKYDIFLSYNRADKDWVRNLAHRLIADRPRGTLLRVFFDEWSIKPGENIPVALELALSSSRKIALVISPESVESAWVELERTIVATLDPANRKRRLLPLFLRGTDTDVPPLVRPLKYIDFRDPAAFERCFLDLVAAIFDDGDQAPVVDEERPVLLSPSTRDLILADYEYRCCVCHTSLEVDLYSLSEDPSQQRSEYSEIAPFCPLCLSRLRKEKISPRRLRAIRDNWRSSCQTRGNNLQREDADPVFGEAVRLSLSNDIWQVKKAIIKCKYIIHHHPFHADAQLLLDKLTSVVDRLEQEERRRDSRLRYTYEQMHYHLILSRVLVWSALIIGVFLASKAALRSSLPGLVTPTIITVFVSLIALLFGRKTLERISVAETLRLAFTEEYIHVLSIYFFNPVRNGLGRRMALSRYSEFIEMEVAGSTVADSAGQPVKANLRTAWAHYMRTGRLPGFAVNESRMRRLFFEDVSAEMKG